MKKIALIALVLSFVLGLAIVPALAEDERGNSTSTGQTTTVFDVTCVQNAIDKRETAIIAALDTYHTAIITALNTRKTSLKAAWALTDRKARREAVATAWKQFRTDSNKLIRTLSAAKKSAWKQFATDRKACGRVPSDDLTGQGIDTNL
jgi:hypothetical protein